MAIDVARAKSLFLNASDLDDPTERAAYLARECGGDVELRARVEALLRANDASPLPPAGIRDATSTHGSDGPPPGEDRGDPTACVGAVVAGKYKLIEEIGEGGMGSVYMAQQTEPVKRAVAVKVIKAGMDSRAVLARFEAERQALALMDHPHIAKVLDAGTTEGGRPFFVMELVKGTPITQYCDDHKLTTRQRLELFVPVCHAIQHAHQKGIIHRDIKPSNVLVAMYDDRPVPKVIDFGVAKATGQSLTDKTLMTGFGAVVGTPEYMSPEQANLNNLDIDTRSDVYSLGVLLYELLTGTTPVDRKSLGKAAVLEILRIVREVEAPRPSAKLTTIDTLPSVAANRGTEPAKLSKLMKGELDWVVMKALNKDRTRRYETANGFAADVQRYLANEPVVARPPSASYRLQKTWQRNKFAFVAASAVALSLILGIAASVWQAVRADREARRALAALNELRETAPAFVEQARALAAKEQFAEAIEKLDYATKLRPNEPDYLIAKGDLLQCQFRFSDASVAYRSALKLRPGNTRALESAQLCDELLAAPRGVDGKLSRESLSKLHVVVQRQQRPAAELMPVSRLLGEEKTIIVAYWLERLKVLPIAADRPLDQRLAIRDDGLLSLDLSGTKVVDLSPLAGAPLARLDLAAANELTSIAPLRGMKLIELNLTRTKVADLSPLENMRTLKKLQLKLTPVSDLSPLNQIRLTEVDITGCPVRDISPLRSAALERLMIMDTRVSDLSPLVGMPLKFLDMGAAPVTDFNPLAGLPLEVCNFPGCQITDLTVLRHTPLRELLLWNCASARNYAVLSQIKTLELLILPDSYHQLPENELAAIESLRTHPRLRQLGAENMAGLDHTTTRSTDAFWQEWDREKTFLSTLRKSGFKYSWHKLSNGTFSLNLENQPFSDLSILKDAPIGRLWLNGCKVSDLNPIRDLPLKVLGLFGNPVEDLRPLTHMPLLEELSIDETSVSDLSPLKGLRLKKLYLRNSEKITDLSPLIQISTLEKVTLPVSARNVELLKSLPNLKMVSYAQSDRDPWFPTMTVEQFWKENGSQATVLKALAKAGITPKIGNSYLDFRSTKIVDLSPLKGSTVTALQLGGTDVADLTPLNGMKLKKLWLYHTKVSDVSALKDMPLELLNLTWTKVSDISVVRGMPLTYLRLNDCSELTDVSPIKEIKTLTELSLPPNAKDFEFLRNFPKLERLSFHEDPRNSFRPDKTAREFWKEYDAKK